MKGCLVIHGYTGGPYEVEPLVDYLREKTDWKIEVPLLPGHGEKLALENVTYDKWIHAAETELKKMQAECKTVYVIGFSMGGMIAAYLAAKYKVDKLVLLATARKYLSFKYMSLYIGEVIGDGLRGKLHENDIYLHYKSKVGAVPFKANIEFMKLVSRTKLYLKDITSPVFIAQGQKDGLVPASTAYYLDKEIMSKQKEVVFFEQSNHLICLGHDKDVLNKMIYNFLIQEEEKKEK